MKSNLKQFLFNKPVSRLLNNIRIDHTEITQLKKKYMMEAEIKTRVTELQQCKVKDKTDFTPFLSHTGGKEIGV